jgi:hypothetical protein
VDPSEIARRLAAHIECGIAEVQPESAGLSVTGILSEANAHSLQALAEQAGPKLTIRAMLFDRPYCDLLAALRPAVPPATVAPTLSTRQTVLRGDERLQLDITAPRWPSRLNLWYVDLAGDTRQLIRDMPLSADEIRSVNQKNVPGERRDLDPNRRANYWEIAAPYGREMIVMVLSDGPLFATARPEYETMPALTEALAGALRAPTRRVAARALVIETRER